eukprot:m.380065 g.380065  ORF g.380065 m.380065 type:complete len:104 (+) comp20033_c0_seq9:2525-2836(+)
MLLSLACPTNLSDRFSCFLPSPVWFFLVCRRHFTARHWNVAADGALVYGPKALSTDGVCAANPSRPLALVYPGPSVGLWHPMLFEQSWMDTLLAGEEAVTVLF